MYNVSFRQNQSEFQQEFPFFDTSPNIISDQTLMTVQIVFVPIRIIICLFGVCANSLNIRTFIRIGLTDSVTISFFVLAFSDFWLLIVGLALALSALVEYLYSERTVLLQIHPMFVSVYFVHLGRIFTTVAMLVTTFLAIQRCLCVAMPLKFNNMFTRSCTSIIIAAIWLFAISTSGAYISRRQIRKTTLPFTNVSLYIMESLEGREELASFLALGIAIVMNMTCQFINAGCVVIMVRALTKSVRFKQLASVTVTNEIDKRKNPDPKISTNSFSSKERQVIVQVTLVTVIFLTANTPLLIWALSVELIPGFQLFANYSNLYSVTFVLMVTIELSNAAFNIFVYYNYNTKFRTHCFGPKAVAGT